AGGDARGLFAPGTVAGRRPPGRTAKPDPPRPPPLRWPAAGRGTAGYGADAAASGGRLAGRDPAPRPAGPGPAPFAARAERDRGGAVVVAGTVRGVRRPGGVMILRVVWKQWLEQRLPAGLLLALGVLVVPVPLAMDSHFTDPSVVVLYATFVPAACGLVCGVL